MKRFLAGIWSDMRLKLAFGIGVWVGGIAVAVAATADREPCTWDIQFYALGKKMHGKSDHAWLLSKDEQAQLFGPFTTGSLYVEPGNAWFQCGNNKVNIITAPLPSGSLLLLKDGGNTWKWKGPN